MYEVVNDTNDFSENGDSGSLVFLIVPDNWPVEANTLFPIGLHVQGDVTKDGQKVSKFIPLYELFQDFCRKQGIAVYDKHLNISFKNPRLEGTIDLTLEQLKGTLPSIKKLTNSSSKKNIK
jgi:hypothetical protein